MIGTIGNIIQHVFEHGHEGLIVGVADIMAVEVFQFGEVETGGGAADTAEIEGIDHFLRGKYLLVAMAPSEPDQVVAQRRRQIAEGAVGFDAQRPMAFRQF